MILRAAAIDLTYLAPLENTCSDKSLSHREKEVAPPCDSPRPMAACVERPSENLWSSVNFPSVVLR